MVKGLALEMHNNFEGNLFSTEKSRKHGGDFKNDLRPYSFVTLSSASAISNDISAKSEVDFHDAAQRTESSCSNSYFIRPLCSSNDNYYQETSMEAKSLSSESLTLRHNKQVTIKEESELVNGFDLNDDTQKAELHIQEQSISENASSSKVIRVMAKLGTPLSLPMSTQKFGGDLGWRGTAVTSAFRAASLPKSAFSVANTDHSSNDSRGSNVFDLNLDPEEDCQAHEFPWKNEKAPIVFHSKDSRYDNGSGSKQEEKFCIDLNAPGDSADDCPKKFPKSVLIDLNLNDDGEAYDDHIELQRRQTSGIGIETVTHPRERRNILGPVYGGDLSHMQVFNHSYGQPFLMGPPILIRPVEHMHRFAPVQPQYSPYAMQVLPYYGHSSLPQALDGGGIRSIPRAPYLLGAVHGQSPIGDLSLLNGRWRESTRQQFLVPNQAATHRKRREPEGGWDALHLGFKHTSH